MFARGALYDLGGRLLARGLRVAAEPIRARDQKRQNMPRSEAPAAAVEALYPRSARANYSLIVLLIAYVLSFIDRQILSLLIGPIRADLAITDFQISLLQGAAFAVFYVSLGLPIGRLADRAPRTAIIASGIFIWSAMTAFCGLAHSFAMLMLARTGVGIGEATLSPAGYSLLSDSFPPARLARALSIFTTGITIGGGLGYVIGGSVVQLVSGGAPVVLPFVGLLKSWQVAFLVVAAPGLVVGAMAAFLKEPARIDLGNAGPKTAEASVRETLGHLLGNWRHYAPIFGAISLLSIVGYGTLNWYPSFLIRTYGISIRDAGLSFGAVYLVFGTLGAVASGLLSERLQQRGQRNANLRVVLWVSSAVAFPAAIGPFMPSPALALAWAAPTVFLLSGYYGVSMASLQLMTPNRMRGLMSAAFLLMTNISGLAIGTSLIAFLTDFAFSDDLALRYSLAAVAVAVCPPAALFIRLGLRNAEAGEAPT
jgi:MFS family permease